MTTIKQVAEAAGVSFKTVSRVVNGESHVSPETRARVQRAIRALDYRPNLPARNMRTQRSLSIGLIASQVATTPFAVDLIKGALDAAREHGRILVIVNSDNDPDHEAQAIETLLERQVEGIIYAAMYHCVITPPPALHQVPVVLANCRSHDGALPSVVPDEVQGGHDATASLLVRGQRRHRRIGFINLEADAPAAVGRLAGYCEALAAVQIAYDPALVLHTHGRADSGYEAMQHLLTLTDAPTAIFCGNDQIAMGAYDAIKERGLRIPHDIAVVGFDNLELIAAYLRPALSTLALPHYGMGRWAVDYLMQGAQADTAPSQMRLWCAYIERESI